MAAPVELPPYPNIISTIELDARIITPDGDRDESSINDFGLYEPSNGRVDRSVGVSKDTRYGPAAATSSFSGNAADATASHSGVVMRDFEDLDGRTTPYVEASSQAYNAYTWRATGSGSFTIYAEITAEFSSFAEDDLQTLAGFRPNVYEYDGESYDNLFFGYFNFFDGQWADGAEVIRRGDTVTRTVAMTASVRGNTIIQLDFDSIFLASLRGYGDRGVSFAGSVEIFEPVTTRGLKFRPTDEIAFRTYAPAPVPLPASTPIFLLGLVSLAGVSARARTRELRR